MIKITQLHYYSPYWHTKTFRQYTADNGESLYTIGNRIVTRDEGNQEFLDTIKASDRHEVKKSTVDADNEAILKSLNDSIDQYVEYIDNYSQYRSACQHNDEIRHIISAFEKVANIA